MSPAQRPIEGMTTPQPRRTAKPSANTKVARAAHPDPARPVRIGVVGLGYWGPNLARNFASIDGCELTWLCDASEQARAKLAGAFPGVLTTSAHEGTGLEELRAAIARLLSERRR